LNRSFSPILHKKFPKCVSIPGILLFVLKKVPTSKLHRTSKRRIFSPDKEKSAGILSVLRAFLTLYGVDKRLFGAIYHYGAPPKAPVLLYT